MILEKLELVSGISVKLLSESEMRGISRFLEVRPEWRLDQLLRTTSERNLLLDRTSAVLSLSMDSISLQCNDRTFNGGTCRLKIFV